MAMLTEDHPSTRFRQHVGFDNIPVGEPTKNNTLSYSLNVSHAGYRRHRRSRTLMVGVNHEVYSDFALQWLLEEYADDGDEIVCVHVTDKDVRSLDGSKRGYKEQAEMMVEKIKRKIPNHRAISIKYEFSVGRLHSTFQKLIQVYQPSMLVVGTKGRSLGGFQGLVNTNSFSKYCLQYSPVPTVVVRDHEKRQKKKDKRSHDPSRQSYASLFSASQGKHEADSDNNGAYDMEARISPDEEAHRVAVAVGLPAAFDPTIKPFNIEAHLRRSSRPSSPATSAPSSPKLGPVVATPGRAASSVGGESEEEDSDEEGEFDVVSGKQVLTQQQRDDIDEKEQKRKLHEMEVNEAAALKLSSLEQDDDEEEEEGGGGGKI